MEKDFINEMDFSKAVKLEKPVAILLTGNPGSGKTTFSRMTSKKLKLFVLSMDYVRNWYWQFIDEYSEEKEEELEKEVLKVNAARLKKIIESNVSFICDSNLNTENIINKLITTPGIDGNYAIIKVKINSSGDKTNIERIAERKANYDLADEEIVGDNVLYSTAYPEDFYYRIKNRKPIDLKDEDFDYVINNTGSLEEYELQIEDVINDIEKMITLNKN